MKQSVYYLQPKEISRIIAFAPCLRDRVIIKILARSGLRRAELAALRVRDIDFERRRIHVHRGKGGEPRTAPTDHDTLQDIRFLIGSRTSGRLLRTARSSYTSISVKQINDIVAKCGRLSGVSHPNPEKQRLNPHLFRHSFVRNAIARGANIDKIQQIAGQEVTSPALPRRLSRRRAFASDSPVASATCRVVRKRQASSHLKTVMSFPVSLSFATASLL